MAKIAMPTDRKNNACAVLSKAIITEATAKSDSRPSYAYSESFSKWLIENSKNSADVSVDEIPPEPLSSSNHLSHILFSADSDCLQFLCITLTVIFGMLAMAMPN